MFSASDGDDVWLITDYGPRQGVFRMMWTEHKSVLVEFDGVPELVAMEDCFVLEQDCYMALSAKNMRSAMTCLKLASEYRDRACGMKEDE